MCGFGCVYFLFGAKGSYSQHDLREDICPSFCLISNGLDWFDTCVHWVIGMDGLKKRGSRDFSVDWRSLAVFF